jgi:uncharacterized membrane protein
LGLSEVAAFATHGGGVLRIKSENELVAINIVSIFVIVTVTLLPSNPLRIVLGLPLILFFPGYTLIAALFPRKADLGRIERVALSFGLSIAVVPLIGLIVNYTPWGIKLYPILASIALFILATSGVAWYRRRRLLEEERLCIGFNVNLSQWTAMRGWDKLLSFVLVASILGAIGALAYVTIAPKAGEKFTEFYILGPEGKAENYPTELTVGEEGKVTLGIVNREHEDGLIYRVEIVIDGEDYITLDPLALDRDEKWDEEVGFIPEKAGEDQKVEFIPYKNGEEEPYRSVYLWLDVKEAS